VRGPIIKGYETEKIAQHLIAKGLENFAISAGVNVRVYGYSYIMMVRKDHGIRG